MDYSNGDKVRIKSKSSGSYTWDDVKDRYNDGVGVIASISGSVLRIRTSDQLDDYEFLTRDVVLFNQKSIMKTLNNMMKKLLDADTQVLAKAEYINGDLELTEKAKNALMVSLFNDKKAELVTLAKEEIAEAEKQTK